MRVLGFLIWFLLLPGAAEASVISIDLMGGGGIPGTGGGSPWPSCYCDTGEGFISQFFDVPDDTVNFGHVDLFPLATSGHGVPPGTIAYIFSSVGVNRVINNTEPLFAGGTAYWCTVGEPCDVPAFLSFDLVFSGGGPIQLFWFSPYIYTAPAASGVPEPSTWAMLILGFSGVGLLYFRQNTRRKRVFRAGEINATPLRQSAGCQTG